MAGTEYPSVRMLVRSGNLELESEDPEAAADRIILIVESYGGYVARLSSSDGEKKSVSIVVKVPESAFYKVLAEIRRDREGHRRRCERLRCNRAVLCGS